MVDFSGAKLASVDFTGSDLSQAIFTSETQFSNGATGVNLNDTNARIDGIFGSVVDFSGAKLASVDFTGSDLSQAIFTSETQFSNGATGVNLNDTNARIDSIFGSVVDFSRAKLASVDFTGSDLSQAIFTSETQFSNGATGVNLNDTNARIDSILVLWLISPGLNSPVLISPARISLRQFSLRKLSSPMVQPG